MFYGETIHYFIFRQQIHDSKDHDTCHLGRYLYHKICRDTHIVLGNSSCGLQHADEPEISCQRGKLLHCADQ